MYYAVTAPGFNATYTDWHMVERARVFYPFLKWKKTYTPEQATLFINQNKCNSRVNLIYNYGDTFKELYITASYEILDDSVEYILDTRNMGSIRLHNPDYIIEYKMNKIRAILPNIKLSADSIASHMSAIFNLLQLVGGYVDVNLVVPNYSVFYALAFYQGDRQRSITFVQQYINTRFSKVGYTLKRGGTDF